MAAASQRRPGRRRHRSPVALVVGLLSLGGLIAGGLQSVELSEHQGGHGAVQSAVGR